MDQNNLEERAGKRFNLVVRHFCSSPLCDPDGVGEEGEVSPPGSLVATTNVSGRLLLATPEGVDRPRAVPCYSPHATWALGVPHGMNPTRGRH